MYTSDKLLKKHLLFNLIGAIFLALFGAVYEAFSHEVYSYFMIYAFAVPLVLGVLVYTVLLLGNRTPGKVFLNLWNSGIAALSVGFVFKGVLDIYGTTNSLVIIYPIAGGMMLTAALLSRLFSAKRPVSKSKLTYDTAAGFCDTRLHTGKSEM